jgi:hypothetical protein
MSGPVKRPHKLPSPASLGPIRRGNWLFPRVDCAVVCWLGFATGPSKAQPMHRIMRQPHSTGPEGPKDEKSPLGQGSRGLETLEEPAWCPAGCRPASSHRPTAVMVKDATKRPYIGWAR